MANRFGKKRGTPGWSAARANPGKVVRPTPKTLTASNVPGLKKEGGLSDARRAGILEKVAMGGGVMRSVGRVAGQRLGATLRDQKQRSVVPTPPSFANPPKPLKGAKPMGSMLGMKRRPAPATTRWGHDKMDQYRGRTENFPNKMGYGRSPKVPAVPVPKM